MRPALQGRAHRRMAPSIGLIAILFAACGPAPRRARILLGPAERLNPIYDFMVAYPDTVIVIGGLPHRGLEIDLEVEFRDPTLRDFDPLFAAEARIVSVLAGGIPQRFETAGPLSFEGTLADGVLSTDLFGPVRVGTANLLLDLTGRLQDGARHLSGTASLFGSPDRGSFVAFKRRRYLVAGTDRVGPIGKVAVVTVRYDTRITVDDDLEVTSSDPIARVEDARPFVINRLNFDNLQGLDPFASFRTSFQYSTGNGSNPHDAVILEEGGNTSSGGPGGLAFVTRYEPPYNDVAVVDLRDGSILDRIDLTPYARNPDHLPRPDQILLHDGLLYVTLEDVNRSFTEFMSGRVAVIDPVRRQVVDLIELAGQNPFEALTVSEATGLIYVGLAGIFPGRLPQALTGGIEVIDPDTRRASLFVDDDALGGNVSAVALGPTRGYCVVSDAAFRNFVKAFDMTSGEVLGTVFESSNQIPSIESDGDGYLLIGENDFFAPRIVLLDAATGQPVASLPLRLPPISFAILTRSL